MLNIFAKYITLIHTKQKIALPMGAGDKQMDAVYIDNQSSTIYIIQGKFYSGDSVDSTPLREVLSSWTQVKDLIHLQDGANQKLQVKINEMANAIEDDTKFILSLLLHQNLQSRQKQISLLFKENSLRVKCCKPISM